MAIAARDEYFPQVKATFADRHCRESGRRYVAARHPGGREPQRQSLSGNAAAASQPMKKNYFVPCGDYGKLPS